MKDMDEVFFVIGVEIFYDRSQGLLELSQKNSIKRTLEKFKMDKCSAGITHSKKR